MLSYSSSPPTLQMPLAPSSLLNLLWKEKLQPRNESGFITGFLRGVGCAHPRKPESWLRGTRSGGVNTASSQRNAGRDSKLGEFAPRTSCIPLGSSSLTPVTGIAAAGGGKFTVQLCCACQCERGAVEESRVCLFSPSSTCSLPGSLESKRGC